MIRLGHKDDIAVVNNIRQEVHKLHAMGESDIFKPEFSRELSEYVYEYIDSDSQWLYVYEEDGNVLGYAMIKVIIKEDSPYRYESKYLEVSELGVTEGTRSRGIGTKLMQKVSDVAKDLGVDMVELNMWEFNDKALKFYEKCGFETYRRHMRVKITK